MGGQSAGLVSKTIGPWVSIQPRAVLGSPPLGETKPSHALNGAQSGWKRRGNENGGWGATEY